MAKKVLFLCSSPNKAGNTNTLVSWLKEGVEKEGGTAEIIDAAHLKYKVNGCIACMGCQRSDKYVCVIEDEAQAVLKRIPEFDTIVFATPLYFFGPSAQMKILTDRMYSLYKFSPDHTVRTPLKGKLFVLAATAGGESFSCLDDTMKLWAHFAGHPYKSYFVPFAGEPGHLKKNEDARRHAIDFGCSLSKKEEE